MPVKPRCTFKECKAAAQRIVGDCGFCDGHFCAKHRLLEDHKCTGLEDVSFAQSQSAPFDNTIECNIFTPAHQGCGLESNDAHGNSATAKNTTQWWLAGLAEVLHESNLLARRSLTSAMQLSLKLSGHRSSGAYNARCLLARRFPQSAYRPALDDRSFADLASSLSFRPSD
ncbi:hypothetical protein GGS20DRAFT_588379 [Poronia punctata]|nr:hypothetical protein GGS20DRAFT_588379 [Poronia punctata]